MEFGDGGADSEPSSLKSAQKRQRIHRGPESTRGYLDQDEFDNLLASGYFT